MTKKSYYLFCAYHLLSKIGFYFKNIYSRLLINKITWDIVIADKSNVWLDSSRFLTALWRVSTPYFRYDLNRIYIRFKSFND